MQARSGLARTNSRGLRGLWIGGLRIGACDFAISRLLTPSALDFICRFGICARSGAERTRWELRGA
eukprot:13667213-Alexandrium_andersonii.AAC.1